MPDVTKQLADPESEVFQKMIFQQLLKNSTDPEFYRETILDLDELLHQDGTVIWYHLVKHFFPSKPIFQTVLKKKMANMSIESYDDDYGKYIALMKQILLLCNGTKGIIEDTIIENFLNMLSNHPFESIRVVVQNHLTHFHDNGKLNIKLTALVNETLRKHRILSKATGGASKGGKETGARVSNLTVPVPLNQQLSKQETPIPRKMESPSSSSPSLLNTEETQREVLTLFGKIAEKQATTLDALNHQFKNLKNELNQLKASCSHQAEQPPLTDVQSPLTPDNIPKDSNQSVQWAGKNWYWCPKCNKNRGRWVSTHSLNGDPTIGSDKHLGIKKRQQLNASTTSNKHQKGAKGNSKSAAALFTALLAELKK